ncbi:MAG: type IV secretory system conjugative DNA transfer family protein [Maricaulaceae bacterium]
MGFQNQAPQLRLGIGVAISLVVLHHAGPLYTFSGINYLAAAGWAGLVLTGPKLAASVLRSCAEQFESAARAIPKGVKGTARWAKSLREFKGDLLRSGWGPYWGAMKRGRDPIFADFASNAVVLGSNGSGKDTTSAGPNILAIRESKTVIDFKGDMACIFKDALEKRGEEVHILNIGAVFADILGPSAEYNVVHLIADNYQRPGGLQDITSDTAEMALKLYPEPKESGGTDNSFFRDGSRELIAFVIQIAVLIKGETATLGDVLQMLNDRESLMRHALWAAGRLEQDDGSLARIPLEESPWASDQSAADLERYKEYLTGLASGIADLLLAQDTRTSDSFLTGARNALSTFNISTRAHQITQASSFRFADQKEEGRIVTVFLVADSSRMEAQRPILEMIQFCMLNEWKRHPNKKKPVYLIGNEAGNFKIFGLASLLTWGRAYSIKLFLYLQSFAAFRKTYDTETLNTLLSEQEILQILPGQSDPETLSLIEKILGQQAVMMHAHSRQRGQNRQAGRNVNVSEDTRPLMSADEVRRCVSTILIIRKNRPALVHTPSIAAIAPFRKQQGINPFYGKPYRLPVALRLRRRAWTAAGLLKSLWCKLWRRT